MRCQTPKLNIMTILRSADAETVKNGQTAPRNTSALDFYQPAPQGKGMTIDFAAQRHAMHCLADRAGRQLGYGFVPDFELWTLRVTLSPALVAGSTVAEQTLLAWILSN